MAFIQAVVSWFGLDPVEREYDEIAVMIGADSYERYQPPGPFIFLAALLNMTFFLIVLSIPILLWGAGLFGIGMSVATFVGLFLLAYLIGTALAHLVFWPGLVAAPFLIAWLLGYNFL